MEYLTIGEDGDAGIGNREVSEELRGMLYIEVAANFLTLDEDAHLTILHDGVIHFLTFFGAMVSGKFGHDLKWVEDIIAKYLGDKWHDESIFGSFFGLDDVLLASHLFRESVDSGLKFHWVSLSLWAVLFTLKDTVMHTSRVELLADCGLFLEMGYEKTINPTFL